MKRITLVIGGCKSGKSRHALDAANRETAAQRIFIATAEPFDDEMKARIARHRNERGNDWHTVEAPINLAAAIKANGRPDSVILVDCLTLWLNNLLMDPQSEKDIEGRIVELIETLSSLESTIYLVSNEVGAGIVPENKLARRFRDLAGIANQAVASSADEVVWMVAGVAAQIK